jgi:hypothetical protein
MKDEKESRIRKGSWLLFCHLQKGKKVGFFRMETVRKSLENKKIKKVKKSVDISHEIIV